MRKGKKMILVVASAVVVLAMSVTSTASFSAPPDLPKSGVPEAVDEMIASQEGSRSNFGPVTAVILVFGLIIGGVIIADKILKHMKKIEELEHQLKEKKEKE